MNIHTIASIEAAVTSFISTLVPDDSVIIESNRYASVTDTCRMRIVLDDDYRIDIGEFTQKVHNESSCILEVSSSIEGDQLVLIIFNCTKYFISSNQIIQEHKKNSKYITLFVIIVFILYFTWLKL